MDLKVTYFMLGPLPTNVYVGVNAETGHAFLVDPAIYDDSVYEAMTELGVKHLDYILLTHGHFDHILGVPGFKEKFPEAKVVISKEDAAFLTDPVLSHSALHGIEQPAMTPDLLVGDGDTLPFEGEEFKVVHTPGHTAGSVCFLLNDLLFCGDTLFHLSCGRTDFPESVPEKMGPSLKKLAALPGNFHVLPGHNELSDLDFERANNPYMR